MILEVYTDGASRSNPGKSASGYQVFDQSGNMLLRGTIYNGIKTNNAAEYIAIILALKAIISKYGNDNNIHLFSDSELVIRQLRGEYKVKEKDLKELNKEAKGLLKKLKSFELNNLPREDKRIAEVDSEINMLLDNIAKKYK